MIFTSDTPEVLAAQVIFLILLPVVLIAPPRWGILAWLLMGNLDPTGPESSVFVVGWMNATKSIILPLYLWWRLRAEPSEAPSMLPTRLWIALTAYAAAATIWSPFPLAAGKLVGNMLGIALTVVVLEKTVRRGLLDTRNLTWLMVGSLALGAVQTYGFRGQSYGFDGLDEPLRFTSFITAQQYAAFLVVFLAVILTHSELRPVPRTVLCAVVCLALALNGSRTWIVGGALVVGVYIWISHRKVAAFAAFVVGTGILGVLLVSNLTRVDDDVIDDTSGRVAATAGAIFTGRDTSHNAGLRNLNFRFAMYNGVVAELGSATTTELLLGHGTSSGGNVAMRTFPTMYKLDHLDPNRVIHNEWLRALYEWGILGLVLLAGVFASLVIGLAVRCRDRELRTRAATILAFMPAFLAAISSENVVAGAGNAVTMSLGIAVALFWTPTSAKRPAWRTS
jgi:O-antigen ligase